MVKLDAEVLRYMTKEDFRVLVAVEMGMKNHEIVPTTLICRIAGLKHGGAFKLIGTLHKNKLIVHDASKYDGYKLTYLGYDYLALKTFVRRGMIKGLGRKIGVGKESDIYEVINNEDESCVLKIHRLGRVSFRAIKSKRDYLLGRTSASWLYMSRLAAKREYSYMQALYDHDFPCPIPYDHNRHCVLMSKVQAYPFAQVSSVRNLPTCYSTLMNLIVKFAEHGLIHCDFNEFNLMISSKQKVTVIDFPQMVSTKHPNAKFYFDRDVQCIRTYFEKRFGFTSEDYPVFFKDAERTIDLDQELAASGFKTEVIKLYDKYVLGSTDRERGEEDEGDEGGNERRS